MQENRTYPLLVIIMMIVTLLSMAVTNYILYKVSIKQASDSLIHTAQSQARLIEAMARYNRRTNRIDWEVPIGERGPTSLLSQRAAADTISQLRDSQANYEGFGETGEFVVAGIEGEQIVFLISHRNNSTDTENALPEPIPLYSKVGEPIRRALLVQSGVMQAKDYRGVEVLAAYEPVDVLNLGIVAKIDLAEIRAPFITGTFYTFAISLVVILLGAFIFQRITNPIIEKIRRSEQQYRSLIEDIDEWVWEVDINGVLTFSNSKVETILSYAKTDVLGHKITDYIKEQNLLLFAEPSKNHAFSLENHQATALTQNGKNIRVEINASPIKDANDTTIGFRGVARDITARYEAEKLRAQYQRSLEKQVKERTQELQDINDELQSFTYIVSHDLRSPLVSIVGFGSELNEDLKELTTELTQNGLALSQHTQQLIENSIPEALFYIDKAAQKMEKLIDSVLALSRLGRKDIVIEPINISEIIDLNLNALAYQLEHVNVTVDACPEIISDENSVNQIFGNLLGNAVKFLRPDVTGEIRIGFKDLSDFWQFDISDNGRGIAESDLPKIFDLFKRVGEQQHIEGDGMGLTYVHTILRRLGGHISCSSKIGKGTTFSIKLPKQ